MANIADSAYNAVGYGMMAVVDQGTGKIARIPGIEVCAKTGTAQNERMISGKRVKLQNHSMFVAYAPRVNPKIAVAVCIENAGYGATWAGPIASLMIEQYLTDTIAKSRLPLKKKMDEAKIIPNYTFIIDSLEKQAARDKEMMKRLSKDSLKILNTINEKIQRRNDTIMAEYFFRSYFLNNAKS
ncbi:MAG TPA: penicillin-binding transpeptidase domain-containing protein [Chitinophagaceae bacterium]|nr:penicillin-binding transpeptidase domain-containing protein [Chitinophagaceae bacterium]